MSGTLWNFWHQVPCIPREDKRHLPLVPPDMLKSICSLKTNFRVEQRHETGQDSEIWTEGNWETGQVGRWQVLFQLLTFKNNVALRTEMKKSQETSTVSFPSSPPSDMLKPGLILCQERIPSWDFPGYGSVEDNVFQSCFQRPWKAEGKWARSLVGLTLKQQRAL